MFGFILHLIKIMPISDGMFQSVVDPLTIGLVIGGVKALAGGIQALSAGKKRPEPKYEIPKEVFEVTQRAEEMARTGMPEASRMQALQGAQQSALFGMRAAQDRRGGLAALGNIQAGLDRANLSVAAQDASMRQQNMVRAQQALMTQAQYKDKAFGNQWQSWMNKEQQRRANIGAGLQNIMGGIDFVGSMAAMGLLGGAGKTTTTNTTNTTISPQDYQRNRFLSNLGGQFVIRPQGRAILGVPEDQNPYSMSEEALASYGTRAITMLPRFF